jgi:2'-5' RNA ligase
MDIRTFFSFHVAEAVGNALLTDLKALPLKLYSSENLHVTLRFIGDTSESDLQTLFQIGEKIAKIHATISMQPLQFGIADGRGRLFVDGGDMLRSLNQMLVSELNAVRIGKPDNRPYTPHITLGRVQNSFDIKLFPPVSDTYGFSMDSFGLYKSEQGKDNMGVYTLLKEFKLIGK